MRGPEEKFYGVGVAPGIARGVVFLHHPDDEEPPKRRVEDSEIAKEIVRFESALIATRAQILEMQQRIAEAIGAKDASIFDAHLLVVEDRTLIDEVLRNLEREKFNVEFIFAEGANRYARPLSEIDDPYLRERAFDIHDVTKRIIRNLLGRSGRPLSQMEEPHIIVAHNLTPSDAATLNRQYALGIATDIGSRTSHTAIMARSLNIPAVVGLKDASTRLKNGDHVLLDGSSGLLILNPADQALWEYGELEVQLEKVEEQLTTLRDTACITTDSTEIILSANIELPEDVDLVNQAGANGVGFYGTGFFFHTK